METGTRLPFAGGSASSSSIAGQVSAFSMTALRRQLNKALGDAAAVLALVQEAEHAVGGDANLLCEVYDLAMRVMGPNPLKTAPREYSDLGVRRLQALCLTDPEEARQFHRFMRCHGLGRQDSRVFLARAEMEARLGEFQKAHSVLAEGFAAKATPAEALLELQKQLREAAVAASPGVYAGSGSKLGRPMPWRSDHIPGGTPSKDGQSLGSSGGMLDLSQLQPRTLRYSSGSGGGAGTPVHHARGPSCGSWTGRASGVSNLSPIVEADSIDVDSQLNCSVLTSDRRLSALSEVADMASVQEQEDGALLEPHDEEPGPGPDAASGATLLPLGSAMEAARPAPPQAAQASVLSDDSLSDISLPAVGDDEVAATKPAKSVMVNGTQYVLSRLLGRGGTSKVYEVLAPSGDRLALKRVVSGCSAHLEAMSNEVTLLQQLTDSPSVVHVYDAEVSMERGVMYIVMEKGEQDLAKILQARTELHYGDVQALWRDMVQAVQVIHDKRIVHSDLKPGNFVLVGGRLKLIDFGIAKKIANETTHIHRDASVGTISFMAPEAVSQGGVKLGRPSDIWSLGIILYQMVYGRSPFAHLEPVQRLLAISDPSVVIEFPASHRLEMYSESTRLYLMDVMQRCLQRDPRRRATIPELLQHPFLNDSIVLSRQVFDRTMEAVVAGFFKAATAALDAASGSSHDADEDGAEAVPHAEAWQELADDVWSKLAANPGSSLRLLQAGAEAASSTGQFAGLAPFTTWLAQGAKRRRVAAPTPPFAAEEMRAQPTPSLRSTAGFSPAVPAPAVVASAAPSLLPSQRPPLAVKLGGNVLSKGTEAAAQLQMELLAKQQTGLKKVDLQQVAEEKENARAALQSNQEVGEGVMRLKQWRALAEPTEEMTQITRWASSAGG
eukprot:TRINITY_DN122092_c0_g1_i1.p1 TRINITY_DN122092_c0_g1~~TRINITY_DN122092_c0_g1_i1.p1  ORF type:complete len:917 (-),score=247.82 TRINITY_DN122092_c0_g1_i1:129-2813(-)